MGEWNPVTRLLKNPRAIAIRPMGDGRPGIFLQKLIGDPKEIPVLNVVTYYELKDKGLEDHYRSEISGIQIVSKIQEVGG